MNIIEKITNQIKIEQAKKSTEPMFYDNMYIPNPKIWFEGIDKLMEEDEKRLKKIMKETRK